MSCTYTLHTHRKNEGDEAKGKFHFLYRLSGYKTASTQQTDVFIIIIDQSVMFYNNFKLCQMTNVSVKKIIFLLAGSMAPNIFNSEIIPLNGFDIVL